MKWRIWTEGERRPNLTLKDDGQPHYTMVSCSIPTGELAAPVTPSAISDLLGSMMIDDEDETR